MHFAIVNESKDPSITFGLVEQIAAACERQLYEHYGPFWEANGASVKAYATLKDVPHGASVIVILEHPDQAGVLGYHDVTPDGRSYGRIFWEPIRDSGGDLTIGSTSLSVTISHEVLETILDPYASFWAMNSDDDLFYCLEACDAVESLSWKSVV